MSGANEIRIVVSGENHVQGALNQAQNQTQQFASQSQRLFEQMRANMARTGQQAGAQFGQNLVAGANQSTQELTDNQTKTLARIKADFARQGRAAGKEFIQQVTGGIDPGALTAAQKSELRQIRNEYKRAGAEAGSLYARSVATSSTDNALTQAQQEQLDKIKARYERTAREAGHVLTTLVASSTDMAPLVKKVEEGGEKAGEEAGEKLKGGMLSRMGDMAANVGGKVATIAKQALLAAAVAIVAGVHGVTIAAGIALVKGIETAMGSQKDNAKLAAQLGLSPTEAKRAGKNAGAIYAQNYGESLADVEQAMRGVSLNIKDLRKTGDASLQEMTAKALDLADAFDIDVMESTRAVGKLMKTGLVRDAKEGFDLITAAMHSGIDEAGDLIEGIAEYSTQFRKLGLDGPTVMGLISQGLKGGARDGDIAADALKEFSLIAVGGSKTSAEAFKALGIDAEKAVKVFSKGGPEAKAMFTKVMDGLRGMKDPVEQNNTALGLFDAKWEDMGAALLSFDPKHAVDALGQVEGAADQLDATLGDTVSGTIEKFKRTVETKLGEVGMVFLDMFKEVSNSDAAKEFGENFSKVLGPPIKEFIDWFMTDVKPKMVVFFEETLVKASEALDGLKSALEDNGPQIKAFGEMISDFLGPAFEILSNTVKRVIEVFTALVTVFGAVMRMCDAVVYETVAVAEGFIDMADLVLSAAVHAFGWLPGIGPKLKSAQADFNHFKEEAVGYLETLSAKLRGLPEPIIRPHVDLSEAYSKLAKLRSSLTEAQYMSAGRYAMEGNAHGGIVGAATGGIHGGMRLVGEQGPELVSLPYGSTVHPAGATRSMLEGANGGGGGMQLQVSVAPGANQGLITELVKLLRYTVRIEGNGDVQTALGTG